MKRKTPLELRSEQLKQRNRQIIEEKIVPTRLASESIEIRKSEQLKIQKYFNIRVNDVYPIKKSSERCRVLYEDAMAKDLSSVSGFPNVVLNPSGPSLQVEGKTSILCENVSGLNELEGADQSCTDKSFQGFRKIDRCSQNMLRNVVELHLGDETLATSAKIDMEKALRGLDVHHIPASLTMVPVGPGKMDNHPSNSSAFGSEFEMSGRRTTSEFEMSGPRIPFDFTLKTSVRLVSSSSVKWCHRSFATPPIDASCNLYSLSSIDGATAQVKFYKSLHSWVYPQSSLPASVVSVLASSAGKEEAHFWLKRQQDWEDSLRSLYYMLRKNICNMFYVYTVQFVALFIGGNLLGKKKRSCIAYVSQSTRGLRSLLRKNKINFTMPLGGVEVEHSIDDDLVELMEIEKRKLGQIFHLSSSMENVDNTSRSLLSFSGHEEVQSLYDILINYRKTLHSFTGSDVPVLFAPVPFQNATLHFQR
ncbi:protein downstream neighbor of Son-like [Zingiber officinale]|uniref:protein downstream neighbor of Son-like n=1 Tax=Zingiber officinale TaxID=94328 RepID=UPI001C4D59F8|nr:protein downstream neighbor of Son-like [Zingiber officinale]